MLTRLVRLAYLLLGIYLMLACLYGLKSLLFAIILASLVSVCLELFLAKYAKND